MRLKKNVVATSAGIVLATSSLAIAQANAGTPTKTGYAPVDGLNMYYEIHGSGQPLILMHGGFGATAMFDPILPELSKHRQVIAVDLQGHGRTADIDRPISHEAMADDIAALIKYLGFEKADVMGYSLGAGTALQTAFRHPELVRRLVSVSTPCKREGWYPEIVAQMNKMGPGFPEQMKQTPMYQAYARIAPRPEDFSVLATKLSHLLKKDYDWSSDVAAIQAPTMIVFGDADAVRADHSVEFFHLLGGGKREGGWDGSGISKARLAILPGLTHYNIFASPALVAAVSPFLDAPIPGGK
jgi:pimeloyl-ACP methyl ester carboxylesterase